MNAEPDPRIVTFNGGTICYHERGDGFPLLMLHGSGPGVSAWVNFGNNLDAFAQGYRCVAPDLPGYGGSSGVEGDPIGGAVEAVLHLMTQLGIDKAHFIGNSFGAVIAARLAADHPDRIGKLVTIGGIGVGIFSSFPSEGIERLVDFVEDPTRQKMDAWLRSMVFDPAVLSESLVEHRYAAATNPASIETNRRIYSRAAIGAVAAFHRGPNAVDTFSYLARINAPTLITWGRDDRVNPLDGAMLPMRLIRNCQLHVFPDCGHWAMIERKADFEKVVKCFLEEP